MIAAKYKTVLDTAQDRLHAATIGLDARGVRIVEATSMNRAPEVCVELEVGAAPIALHRAEESLEVLLHLGVCAVEHVPRTTPPAAKRDLIRAQRFSVRVFHEPIRMLLEYV